MGEYLHAAGMTVYGIRLQGHGTCPEDLKSVGWQEWVQDVREGLGRLRKLCKAYCCSPRRPHEILYLEEGGHTVVLDRGRRKAWAAARAWLA
ncbi:MAG: alpha/beta hydrolase [Anaerolineales bacterium]